MKKKMLFVCAAGLLTAGIASAEVPSYNIVGYLENKNVAPSYFTGPTFVQVLTCLEVDPNLGLTLSDIKIEGMDPMLDSIQFLSTEDAGTLISATYVEAPPAFKGWWDFYDLGGTRLDEEDLPAGLALLCNFTGYSPVKITFPDPTLPLAP